MSPPRRLPVSRRDRPAKAPLTREAIVAATVGIMQRDGLQAATMRRVAQALDTGPASLYVYVANTAELHAAVLDTLLGRIGFTADGDWETRLRRLLSDYRDLLSKHPGLARSALTLRPSGPHTLRLLDTLLALLLEGGLRPERAAWSVDLLMLYATALAAEHGATTTPVDGADRQDRWESLVDAVRHADPAVTPHVAQHADVLLGGTHAERWDWALGSVIAGARRTPTRRQP